MKIYRVKIVDQGIDQILVQSAAIEIPVERAHYRIWQSRTSAINCAAYWRRDPHDKVTIEVADVDNWAPFDLQVDKLLNRFGDMKRSQLQAIARAAVAAYPREPHDD